MSETPGRAIPGKRTDLLGVLAVRDIASGTVLYDVEGSPRLLTRAEAFDAITPRRTGYRDPIAEHLALERLDGNAAYAVDAFVNVARTSYAVEPRQSTNPEGNTP